MKTLVMILMLAADSIAWGQDGISCTKLTTLEKTVCRSTVGGETTYTASENDSTHSDIHFITEAEYTSALKSNTEIVNALVTTINQDNVRREAIAKYGKRYYERALSCFQDGGTWSGMRHTCKVGKQ